MTSQATTIATDVGTTSDGSNTSSTLTLQTELGHPLSHPIHRVTHMLINGTATAHNSTQADDGGGHGVPGGVIALLICLLLVGVGVLCVIFYLKRTGKLYKMIPFKPLVNPRRSSMSSSRGTLTLEEGVERDQHPPHNHDDHHDRHPNTVEVAMFTIEDGDMETVDIDRTSRGTNDEYFYDEVFAKSGFEDEVTNASMRHLYLTSDHDEEEEMLDVDAIVTRVTGMTSQTTKT